MTRTFSAAQIGTGFGRLITSMDDVYAVLNYMTGDTLYTHQLPRALDACRSSMLAQHPWLADVDDVAEEALGRYSTPKEAMREVELLLNRRHGTALWLIPLRQWDHRDPIEELCDMVGTERVFVAPEAPR